MKCIESECTHYIFGASKLSFPLLRDKISLCNRCGDPFILTRRALRMAEPCCDQCVKKRKSAKAKSAEDFFAELTHSLDKG